jgi:site-specific recombinase XerD
MRMKTEKETPPATWSEAVDRFLHRLEERRRSAKTVRCYREELTAYAAWHQAEFEEPPSLQAIMEGDLGRWMSWLQDQKLKPATINKKRAALKSFLRWSEVKGFLDPIEMPDAVKTQESALRWLSKNQEHALLRVVERGKVLRDRALILFFLRCGVRIEEASTLRRGALRLQAKKGWATIKGKGDKEREVPIDNDTTKLLHELLKTLESPESDPHVFQGQRGGLTPSALHRIVVGYAGQAKLDGVTAHNLRHTCAKRLLDSGSELTDVAAIMGHASLNTTKRYVKPGKLDLERAVARRAGNASNDDE